MDFLSNVPDGPLSDILSFLDPVSRSNLRCTSRKFAKLSPPYFWHEGEPFVNWDVCLEGFDSASWKDGFKVPHKAKVSSITVLGNYALQDGFIITPFYVIMVYPERTNDFIVDERVHDWDKGISRFLNHIEDSREAYIEYDSIRFRPWQRRIEPYACIVTKHQLLTFLPHLYAHCPRLDVVRALQQAEADQHAVFITCRDCKDSTACGCGDHRYHLRRYCQISVFKISHLTRLRDDITGVDWATKVNILLRKNTESVNLKRARVDGRLSPRYLEDWDLLYERSKLGNFRNYCARVMPSHLSDFYRDEAGHMNGPCLTQQVNLIEFLPRIAKHCHMCSKNWPLDDHVTMAKTWLIHPCSSVDHGRNGTYKDCCNQCAVRCGLAPRWMITYPNSDNVFSIAEPVYLGFELYNYRDSKYLNTRITCSETIFGMSFIPRQIWEDPSLDTLGHGLGCTSEFGRYNAVEYHIPFHPHREEEEVIVSESEVELLVTPKKRKPLEQIEPINIKKTHREKKKKNDVPPPSPIQIKGRKRSLELNSPPREQEVIVPTKKQKKKALRRL